MKNLNYINRTAIVVVCALAFFTGCEDPDYIEANPGVGGTPAALSTFINFVNASPDAPSLDLYFNNVISGSSLASGQGQQGYVKHGIASNGVLANANVRAKGTSGQIGGTLESNDLIFRAGNNNANNFQAVDSAYYTFIALDSITRPRPLRTNNALGIGDTTYFNPLTGQYIAGITRAPLPSSQKSRTVAIGTVPLGATDPGGARFLVITDQQPLPSTTRLPKPAPNKAAVRFIHASPNTGSVTVSIGAQNLVSSGTNPPQQGIFSYPLAFAVFNPSVGSRSVTANVYASIDPGTPVITVRAGAETISTRNDFTFVAGGVYTIVLTGNFRQKPSMPLVVIQNK
jgi:hypothetical protein